jgi:hypothetical protein
MDPPSSCDLQRKNAYIMRVSLSFFQVAQALLLCAVKPALRCNGMSLRRMASILRQSGFE